MNGFLKALLFAMMMLMAGNGSIAQSAQNDGAGLFEKRLSVDEETVVPVEAGSPVFLMGETVLPTSQKQPQKAFVPTPVNWQQKGQELSLQTPFGETFSVPYVEHIPYFFVSVQLLSNGQALVTENIRLITTSDGQNPTLSRTYDTKVVTPQGVYMPVERVFLKAEHNYSPTPIVVETDDPNDRQIVSFPELTSLEPGLHIFQISYLVPRAVMPGQNVDLLFLGILGRTLPYPIEKMGILVSVPTSTKVVGKKVLFGENNIAVEQTVEIGEDEEGHIAMKMTRLLPPMTDVRIDLMMEKAPVIEMPFFLRITDYFFDHFWIVLTCLLMVLIIVYYGVETVFRGTALMQRKTSARVAKRLSYAPEVMRYALYRQTDKRSAAAVLLSLAQKGSVLLAEQVDGSIQATKHEIKPGLSPIQTYLLRRLFPADTTAVQWYANVFQDDGRLKRLVRLAYTKEYVRVAVQELSGGWILTVIALVGSALSGLTPGRLGVMALLLSAAVLFGTRMFISKGRYQGLIREAYKNMEQHLTALSGDAMTLDKTGKNVSAMIALDCVRRNSAAAQKKVIFPIVLKNTKETAIPLTFIEKTVLNN